MRTVKLIQENYLRSTDKLSETRAALRRKEDELDESVDSNASLRTSLRVLQQQAKSLERQLTDAHEAVHTAEANLNSCKSQLLYAKNS
jgi:septal ring factor EnvC (AmiA/AmiB activator)